MAEWGERVAIPSITGLRSNKEGIEVGKKLSVAIPSITGLRSNVHSAIEQYFKCTVAIPSITGLRSNEGFSWMRMISHVAIPSITGLRSNPIPCAGCSRGTVAIPSITGLRSNGFVTLCKSAKEGSQSLLLQVFVQIRLLRQQSR